MEFDVDTTCPWAVSWTVREPMRRSSHALAADGQVWLVDPVDCPEALAAAEKLGTVTGVVKLLDRHPRDCQTLAERYGAGLHELPGQLPGTPFECFSMVRAPGWKEMALWWPEHEALLVAESVGTGPYFAVAGRPAGIHPMLRVRPPGALRAHRPRHLLPGHGPPLHRGADVALADALSRSRRDLPRAMAAAVGAYLPGR